MRGVPNSIARDRRGGRSPNGAARGGVRRGRVSVPWVGLDSEATLAEHGIDSDVIMAALADRDAARANRDYVVADRIQNHLRSDLRLYMDDKERTWSVTPQLSNFGQPRNFGSGSDPSPRSSKKYRGGGGSGGRSREYEDTELW